MIKQIMSGLACKRTQFQGNPARKKGKAYGLCPFKSTGTVLFLPHPKRRNARPGSGFLLPLPQRISGDCRSQRLRQIHDFVPDRRLLTPAAAASRFMGKMVISPASATCCSTIFYLNGETSGKNVTLGLEIATRIQPGTWNAFAGCSPTTGFWNFSIKSRLSFPAACANGLPHPHDGARARYPVAR